MRTACFVLVVCLVVGCEGKPAGKGGGKPTGKKPPVVKIDKDKTPKATPDRFKNANELGAYLNDRGVKVTVEPGMLFDRPERPCSAFVGTSNVAVVLVYLCKSEAEAEEFVGTTGDKGFRYARFVMVNHGAEKVESGRLFDAMKIALK